MLVGCPLGALGRPSRTSNPSERTGRDDIVILAALRRGEREALRVQHEAIGFAARFFVRVEGIAEDREADRLQVEAQLVRAAGDGRELEPRAVGETFEHAPSRERGPPYNLLGGFVRPPAEGTARVHLIR